MVAAGEWDDAVEIARRQVRGGAQIIDVCLQTTEGDETEAVHEFYDRLGRAVKVPVMIDSTDAAATEVALTYCQGKSIINSINLEDGEERLARIAPLLRRYGGAVILGSIDEDPVQAQAFTRERKLEVARRGHGLLTGKYGIPGDRHHLRSTGLSGGERRRELHRRRRGNHRGPSADQARPSPRRQRPSASQTSRSACRSGPREIVNSVFLFLCTRAGLDLAIVNTERVERYAAIPGERARDGRGAALQHTPAAGRSGGREALGASLRTGGIRTPGSGRQFTPSRSRASRIIFEAKTGRCRASGATSRRTPGGLHHRRKPYRSGRGPRRSNWPVGRRPSTSSTAP